MYKNASILKRFLYVPISILWHIGDTILGKSVAKDYRNKKRRPAKEDELMVYENTHEPIITQEMWDRAQKPIR